MDDKFLHEQRRDPDPAFARALRERLRRAEAAQAESPRGSRWVPAFAAAAAAAFVVAAFTVPSVRAFAQAALDLFRVQEFAVVQVDEARLEQLKNAKVDMTTLVGDHAETLLAPGPEQRFASIEAATAAAGFAPLRPTILARGLALDTVLVQGESRTRVTVDTKPVRELLQAMDVRDVTIPAGLDGQRLTIHQNRMMAQSYRRGENTFVVYLQGQSPEVELPPGLDLAQLGEVGLRLLGLEPAEARRLAAGIDWRSTLVVPVIAGASQYQQVRVQGARGLYIEMDEVHGGPEKSRGPGRVVMWTSGGRVQAMLGNIDRVALMSMAESVR